jgi:rRNA-processing protein FCF1
MLKVLLDTSFLVNCVKFKLDFKKELKGNELLLIPTVVDELHALEYGDSEDSKHAHLAIKIIEGLGTVFEPEKHTGDADGSLLSLSRQGYVIATQDMPLRAAVKEAGGRVAYIRQRKKIVIE